MHATPWITAALALVSLPALAHAQPRGHLAAVLAVEDAQRGDLVEEVGVATYGRFLRGLPYERLIVVRGKERSTERIAAAIRALAAEHRAVDVFLSTHTTDRQPAELRRLLPFEARKVRLVYSTACEGYENEREAWLAIGARTVVTHLGINNPLWSFPLFLTCWLQGLSAEEAVGVGLRETSLGHRFLFSLPGSGSVDRRVELGSVPSLDGDPSLTIVDGLLPPDWIQAGAHRDFLRAIMDPALRYDRATGSTLGLAMRAMASEGFTVSGARVAPLLQQLELTFPFDALDPDRIESARIRHREITTLLPPVPLPILADPARLLVQTLFPQRVTSTVSELALESSAPQSLPLGRGFRLELAETVTLRPGRLDPEARVVEVHLSGVEVVGYGIRVGVRRLRLAPSPEGYRVTIEAELGGIVRLRPGFELPSAPPPRPQPGLVGALGVEGR